jgi:hypothetical protein
VLAFQIVMYLGLGAHVVEAIYVFFRYKEQLTFNSLM